MRSSIIPLAVVVLMVGIVGFLNAASPDPILLNASARRIEVRFSAKAPCSGVDPKAAPVAAMAPIGRSTNARVVISPDNQYSRISFVSDNGAIASVSPGVARDSEDELTISGVTKGATFIRARTTTSSKLQVLDTRSRPRRDKLIAIHGITQVNDDVQITPQGSGPGRNFICVTGAGGVLHSEKFGDDEIDGFLIRSGDDGICSSLATGGDTQNIGQLHSYPCIGPGPNGALDSVRALGDLGNGPAIETGGDGICNSNLNNAPKDVPSADQLRLMLDEIWGVQTNIHFTVSRSDAVLDYDLNHDRVLTSHNAAGVTIPEELDVLEQASTADADFDIYYVREVQDPDRVAFAIVNRAAIWIGDKKAEGSLGNVTAHELGHLFQLRPGPTFHSPDTEDLMYATELENGTVGCEMRLVEWERAWLKVD